MENDRIGCGFISGAMRIIAATLLCAAGMAVLSIVTVTMEAQDGPLSSRWFVEISATFALLIYSLLFIVIFSRGRVATFGFSISGARDFGWGRMMAIGLGIGVGISSIGLILKFDAAPPIFDYTFLQLVVIVWIVCSLVEEVWMRGLVQSFLAPLKAYGVSIAGRWISLPVFVAALLFGLVHMGILTTGASALFVAHIVFFTFCIGLAAGYYREKTNSLIPAFIIHSMANVGGSGFDLLVGLFR